MAAAALPKRRAYVKLARGKWATIARFPPVTLHNRLLCIITDPGRTDEDKVRGFFEPVGMKKLHDLVSGDFGVKGPIKVLKELDPFDPGGTHQVLDSLSLPELILLLEESLQQSRFFLVELVGISQQFKRLSEIREAHHSL